MKNKNRPGTLVFGMILFVCISGCEKIETVILENPTSDYKPCNILTLTEPPMNSKGTFYYNKYGNPDSVKFTVVSTGYTNAQFRYDAQQRLTDYIKYYNNGSFELWTRYIYDSEKKKIIAFKSWVFGELTTAAEPTSFALAYPPQNVVYDAEGRTGGPYDAAGNRILQGVTYDNKVNIHRANKVWMIADNDYSRNNPVTALSYNRYGFPRQYPDINKYSLSFLGRFLQKATVTYQCD